MLPTYGMLLALFATLYLLNTLLAPFADDVLRVGASGLGFIDAMFACGAIVGGVVLPLVTARVNRDRVAAVGVVGMGITLIALSRSVHLALPMLLYASAGICFQSFYIFRSRVQEQVPIALQGRVMSLLISSVGVCRLVVYGLLALFASDAALRSAYATAGAALLTLGVLVTVAAFRAKTASAPPEVEPELETDAGGTPDVAPPGTPAPPSLPEAPSDRTALAASVPAERS
jgi:hypothetical protein